MLRLIVALALTVATVASAQSYKVLHNFGGNDGAHPVASLIISGQTLYGTACGGDSYSGINPGDGVVFKVNTDGSGYAVLKQFNGSDGEWPEAGLVLASNTLYGTTEEGGSSNNGVVFKLNTDGSGYTVLKDFTGSDGAYPCAGLVLASNTLCGTTTEGGSSGNGTVFKVNTDGSGFAVLKNFAGSDGSWPLAGLVLSDNTLYGTTCRGGSANYGVLFEVNTDGSGFAVIKNFIGSDGAVPRADLLLSGGTLYGTTWNGGISPDVGHGGLVFKVNTDGSGFAMLKSFTGANGDGECPAAGLVLVSNTLYGTTEDGGICGCGTVFKVNTDGSGFAVLKRFTGPGPAGDGEFAGAGLVLEGSTFYGTTVNGGANNCGVVFSLTCLSITAQPLSQTAEAGTTVGFQVGATSATPRLAYQWFFDGTNALASATNAFLQLANIQPVQAGAYTVVVTNLVEGAVTSVPALLSVIPPVDRRVVPAVHLTGGTGSFLHLEYAESLTAPQWSSLSNLTLSGGPQCCFDLCQPVPAQRFYRAWQTNGTQPTLRATTATEIPLAGATGSSVRVDYINQVGPTDAWVTLDTVTLSNSPQLYFDLTAFGQPTRLYRLVPVP